MKANQLLSEVHERNTLGKHRLVIVEKKYNQIRLITYWKVFFHEVLTWENTLTGVLIHFLKLLFFV